jgi:hypothetical protein
LYHWYMSGCRDLCSLKCPGGPWHSRRHTPGFKGTCQETRKSLRSPASAGPSSWYASLQHPNSHGSCFTKQAELLEQDLLSDTVATGSTNSKPGPLGFKPAPLLWALAWLLSLCPSVSLQCSIMRINLAHIHQTLMFVKMKKKIFWQDWCLYSGLCTCKAGACWAPVAQAYNPSYSRSRDQEN